MSVFSIAARVFIISPRIGLAKSGILVATLPMAQQALLHINALLREVHANNGNLLITFIIIMNVQVLASLQHKCLLYLENLNSFPLQQPYWYLRQYFNEVHERILH